MNQNKTKLVRAKIAGDFRCSSSVNPSLLLQKGFQEIAFGSDKAGTDGISSEKTAHLKKVANLPASEEYVHAFNRWFTLTEDPSRFQRNVFKIATRLLIGLTGNGVLETGCSVSRNYGMPYIPGSSITGVVRAWAAEHLSSHSSELDALFGTYDSEQVNRVAGDVTFHDAWWIPKEGCKPFVLDVVTTHHQNYYNGNLNSPSD